MNHASLYIVYPVLLLPPLIGLGKKLATLYIFTLALHHPKEHFSDSTITTQQYTSTHHHQYTVAVEHTSEWEDWIWEALNL